MTRILSRQFITLFTVLSLIGGIALAADDLPLEITADHALEWNQTARTYIARGNAEAKQGELSVKGDVLTAEYAGEDNSTSDLTKVTAKDHVIMTSVSADGVDTATGDLAVYDLALGTITLTGTPTNTRPKITKGQDSLEADQIIVTLKNQELETATAIGDVVITTAGEQKASGDKAIFTKTTNIAELIGHVKIMQGFNWLEGDYAKMNLTTKISTITGQKDRPRVKGIFYPSSGKKK
ncbi:MAG: LptA/OstA family protein [Alphaproteobacteria bacterium]|nr:LptA/OstA family protein [Alphaproteobacteria bacterium]